MATRKRTPAKSILRMILLVICAVKDWEFEHLRAPSAWIQSIRADFFQVIVAVQSSG